MVLIDTGDQQRAWTQSILKFYKKLGRPKIAAVILTHGHGDHHISLYLKEDKALFTGVGGDTRWHDSRTE